MSEVTLYTLHSALSKGEDDVVEALPRHRDLVHHLRGVKSEEREVRREERGERREE